MGGAKDLPADRSPPTSSPPLDPTLREAARSQRRRRPTGAAPPLPYRLQTSGIGWLIAAVVLAGLTLALLVLRRWRHLIVWWVATNLGGFVAVRLASAAQRPRPFGVDIQASWGGWALPSLPVFLLAAVLVGILYTLVPEGRWRNTGKWLATALIALVAVARIALGVDTPSDVLVGVGIGVAFPLLAFRRFTPSEVYPVTYRRGRSAHLDVGGARGQAIRRALEDQLGLVVQDVKPFGLSGSVGSTPLRITVEGIRPGSCSASCTPRATCAPTAGTRWAGNCCTAAWRTRSRSTPCGGWSSRRTTRCTSCTPPGCPLRGPTGLWS